jgi:hypothetical protein
MRAQLLNAAAPVRPPLLDPKVVVADLKSGSRAVAMAILIVNHMNEYDRLTYMLRTAPSRQARRSAQRELDKFAGAGSRQAKRGLTVPVYQRAAASPSKVYVERLPDGRRRPMSKAWENARSGAVEPQTPRRPTPTERVRQSRSEKVLAR